MCPNEMKSKLLFADIGNTHFHIYDGKHIEHLLHTEAIAKYKDRELCYISVKSELAEEIKKIESWKNISNTMRIEGEYDTMGVDRKALCMSHNNGLFIDAGSAITVDVMENGKYMGGFILPGLQAYLNVYKTISPVLDVSLNKGLDFTRLPATTKDGISYGIIASIKSLIDKHSEGKRLYFTGGDGKFLSSFFKDAVYDETLVFCGMLKAIKDKDIC